VCFLCKGFVSYKEGDTSKFNRHMNNEHMAYFGLEYLLAGCTMSEEERLAVRDVIKDRIEPTQPASSTNNTVVATLEEMDDTPKPKKGNRYKCAQCPISFSVEVNLKTHMEVHQKQAKLKSNKGDKTSERSKEILKAVENKESGKNVTDKKRLKSTGDEPEKENMDDSEEQSPKRSKISTEDASKNKSDNASVLAPKSKKQNKNNTSKTKHNKTGNGSQEEVGKDQDPGDGKICPVCSKEFQSNGPMRRHFEDIHQPGEFPCKGCGRVFSSKNKVSSHFSRNCKDRRTTM